jgi:hypothetical protein
MQWLDGTILWFKPAAGQGLLCADSGRRYFFPGGLLADAQPGLRVRFRIQDPPPQGQSAVAEMELPGGRKELVPLPGDEPPRLRGAGLRGAGGMQGPKPRRPNVGGAAASPARPRSRGPFGVGSSVTHPTFGQGFVVLCTPSMVRVRFTQNGQERSVRVQDVKSLD